MPESRLNKLFRHNFGSDDGAFTVRAPGRVNLIGEHVDYNDGLVLPMAISMQVLMRVRPRTDRRVELLAADFDQRLSFSLDDIEKQSSWIDYVQGVAAQLLGADLPIAGFEGVVSSNLPIASGLSSSAAIEVASALAFLHAGGCIPMNPTEIALLCQRAENYFIGVNSGIMDQMSVAACHEDHALLLDCRDLSFQHIPLVLREHAIIVTDSGAPRELAGSAYNTRRAECDQGLAMLQQVLPGISSLRDVDTATLAAHAAVLPPVIHRRLRHVVEEIERTKWAANRLRANDMAGLGTAMNESHHSLADLYEVSSPELDWLTSWARRQPGVLGSRLTGAGFGGCTVTLIERHGVDSFIHSLPEAYAAALNRQARCWVCEAEAGAQLLSTT